MNKIFVYGILIGTDPSRQPAVLTSYERFYRGHATIKQNHSRVVIGELIELNDDDLKLTDMIEGVAQDYYHRFKVSVHTNDGIVEGVWVYQQVEDKK